MAYLVKSDICAMLGTQYQLNEKEFCDKSFCRLYFSPEDFPPSSSGINIGQCPNFCLLKSFIKVKPSQRGSSIICCGGHKGCNEMIFRCQKCYGTNCKEKINIRNVKRLGVCCPFSFTVWYDEARLAFMFI